MKVIVVGGGFANKGAEAMLKTVRSELERRIGDVQVVVWDAVAAEVETARSQGFDAACAAIPGHASARASWLARSLLRHPSALAPHIGGLGLRSVVVRAKGLRLLEQVGDFDAVLDISGFAYGDSLGIHAMTLVEPLLRAASERGRPYVFLPQAWGPFTETDVARATKTMLSASSAFAYARDRVSLGHLSEVCPPDRRYADPMPDIAFSFSSDSDSIAVSFLHRLGCEMQRPLVCIAPNMRAARRQSQGANPYLEALCGVGRLAVDELGADVVLQANEIKVAQPHADDRALCTIVAEAIDRPGRVFHSDEALSAEDSKSLVGRCEFLVASRFHSLVFALSQRIPCVAVGWSHKYSELLDGFDLTEATFDIGETDAEGLRRGLLEQWARRQRTAQVIGDRLTEIRKANEALFDDLVLRIGGRWQ